MRVTVAQPFEPRGFEPRGRTQGHTRAFEPRGRTEGHTRWWLVGALLVLVAIPLACCLGAPPLARWLAYLTLSATAGLGGGIAAVVGLCALLRRCARQ